jgi:hypothetical protein
MNVILIYKMWRDLGYGSHFLNSVAGFRFLRLRALRFISAERCLGVRASQYAWLAFDAASFFSCSVAFAHRARLAFRKCVSRSTISQGLPAIFGRNKHDGVTSIHINPQAVN